MIELTVALILFLVPLAYSPGPGNLFFAANGARFGFSATVPANVGYHAATFLVTLLIGLGFKELMASAPAIFTIMRYAGALYVLWLAYGLWRAGSSRGDVEAEPASAFDGALLLVLNPKAYIIIALMFSQFLKPERQQEYGLTLWIAIVFTLNNAIAFSLYAGLADGLAARWRTPDKARLLDRVFAIVLVVVAMWMLSV